MPVFSVQQARNFNSSKNSTKASTTWLDHNRWKETFVRKVKTHILEKVYPS